jgi:hypothetical protein
VFFWLDLLSDSVPSASAADLLCFRIDTAIEYHYIIFYLKYIVYIVYIVKF